VLEDVPGKYRGGVGLSILEDKGLRGKMIPYLKKNSKGEKGGHTGLEENDSTGKKIIGPKDQGGGQW